VKNQIQEIRSREIQRLFKIFQLK